MAEQPNVILLSIDALRADHLGYHGYERDTSPFLDSLADRTVSFMTAISASSHTREAMPSLLSGEYPDVFGANGYRYTTETIADRLSEDGYPTAGFHSNPYLSRAYGYDSGFDEFDDDLRLGQNRYVALLQRAIDKFILNKGEYHARAEEINRKSLEWLDSHENEPVFLWNHYMDPHGPYNPPENNTFADSELSNSEAHDLYQKIINRPADVTDDERQLLIDCYDGEIRYLDSQLESFFDALEDRGLIEDSLLVVTADHGDAFGEHGYYTHPRHLHESLLHVPLLVSPPGDGDEENITAPVSTLDVVPTILESVSVSENELPGTPLVDGTGQVVRDRPEVVFASATGEDDAEGIRRFAARRRRWKAVLERVIDSGEILDERVFDLQIDPEERNSLDPIEADADDVIEKLRRFSASRLDSVDAESGTEATHEPATEIDERLEALGYK